jgi:hypothetical protein
MLYSEIIAVCSQIHTKHINTLCGQNAPRNNVIKRKFRLVVNVAYPFANLLCRCPVLIAGTSMTDSERLAAWL